MSKLLKIGQLYDKVVGLQSYLSSPLLLAMRLYWGWSFFQTGKGKLLHLDQTTSFFMDLGIPMAKFNAMMAGTTECVGGMLLFIGLGSRLISMPLAITMIVAYLTAHREALTQIFSNPAGVTSADPFLFLLTALMVIAFGPGAFSLDALIAKLWQSETNEPTPIKQPITI